MNVKVLGYLRCAQAVAPLMIEQGWGRIINISGLGARSTGAVIGSMRNVAVAAMTKNLADELGPHGINVTVVHPGLTRTEATPGVIDRLAAGPRHLRRPRPRTASARNSIRRIVDAAEVADVVAFLASPRSGVDHRRRHRLRRRAARPDLLLIRRGRGAEVAEEQLGGRPVELEVLVGRRREDVGDVRLQRLLQRHVAAAGARTRTSGARGAGGRSRPPAACRSATAGSAPMIGSKRWSSQRTAAMFSGGAVPGAGLQLGAEAADVVEQPAGLVLPGPQPGEGEQPLLVVAALDDARHEAQALAVLVGEHLHLADVEAEVVEPAQPLLDLPHLVGGELLDRRSARPTGSRSATRCCRRSPRVDVVDEPAAGLQVEQAAGDVLGGDVEVDLALPVGQLGRSARSSRRR